MNLLSFLLGVVLCTVPTNAVQAGECDLCVQVVSAVEEYVAQGLTPDEILAEIEGLCEGLGILQGICENLIENNLKPIIDNLEDQLSPYHVCQILGLCADGTTPSPEPKKWVYIETMLEGGRVLTVEPDKHHVWMHGKTGNDNQMWRLEDNGCLRNKAHMDRCLGTVEHIVGSGLDLQIDGGGIGSQQWRYKDKYLVNLADTAPRELSMNVIWGDVPLITDGAGVNIIRQDDTLSMHWRFVEP